MIYRECARSEFDLSNYGQSWTTSKEIVQDFAFHHYSSQGWFVADSRAVLWVSCRREIVLFFNQTSEGEFEVVLGQKS